MADDSLPFEKFFDALDAINELVKDGPDDNSSEFLKNLNMEVAELARVTKTLTVENVDAEFTEDEDEGGEDGETI